MIRGLIFMVSHSLEGVRVMISVVVNASDKLMEVGYEEAFTDLVV